MSTLPVVTVRRRPVRIIESTHRVGVGVTRKHRASGLDSSQAAPPLRRRRVTATAPVPATTRPRPTASPGKATSVPVRGSAPLAAVVPLATVVPPGTAAVDAPVAPVAVVPDVVDAPATVVPTPAGVTAPADVVPALVAPETVVSVSATPAPVVEPASAAVPAAQVPMTVDVTSIWPFGPDPMPVRLLVPQASTVTVDTKSPCSSAGTVPTGRSLSCTMTRSPGRKPPPCISTVPPTCTLL